MDKIRLNELARELEIKSQEILDALPNLGGVFKKTHSSSLDREEEALVREFFKDRVKPIPPRPSEPLPSQAVVPAVMPVIKGARVIPLGSSPAVTDPALVIRTQPGGVDTYTPLLQRPEPYKPVSASDLDEMRRYINTALNKMDPGNSRDAVGLRLDRLFQQKKIPWNIVSLIKVHSAYRNRVHHESFQISEISRREHQILRLIEQLLRDFLK